MELRLNHERPPCTSFSSFATRRACALEGLPPARSPRYGFSPILFTCNRLRTGVNGKLKWLVQGGNYREMTPPCLDS